MASVEALRELFGRRIVVLDGAMGTMVQALGLRGCYDDLARTHPDAIEDIHLQFLRAGADIVETDTFTATTVALADFGLEGAVRELNVAAAQVARRAAD